VKHGWKLAVGAAFVVAGLWVAGNWFVNSALPVGILSAQHWHESLQSRLERDRSGLETLNHEQLTPLQTAVKSGCITCATLLLRAGADPEKPLAGLLNLGVRPLHLAATAGDPEMVKLLASSGAPLNATDSVGDTALHAAVHWKKEGAAKTLLELGADPNVADANSWGPLHWAALWGHDTLVPALVQAGARIDQPVRVKYLLEEFVQPQRDRMVGYLHLTMWPDLEGKLPARQQKYPLFYWHNRPKEKLGAEQAEVDPSPRLMTPLDLSRLLNRESVAAYLESQLAKKAPARE